MPLTHDFRETVRARAQAEPKFRQALLREAVESILNGELSMGRSILRDYVNATIGFQGLEKQTRIPAKSLMRMLGPKGSPSIGNLASILNALQQLEGVRFSIKLTRDDAAHDRQTESREALAAHLDELGRKSKTALKKRPAQV